MWFHKGQQKEKKATKKKERNCMARHHNRTE